MPSGLIGDMALFRDTMPEGCVSWRLCRSASLFRSMAKGERGPPGPRNVFCTRPQRPVADEMRLMGLTVSARLGTSMPVLGPGPPLRADRPSGAGRLLFLLPAISAGGGGDLKRRFDSVDGESGTEAGETASDCARLSLET
jgi:hypothetical protein